MTDENYGLSELESFVEIIIKYNLKKCDFLISTDYKEEQPAVDKFLSLMILYYLLYKEGIFAVTLDDHVFKRIMKTDLKSLASSNNKILPEKYKGIVQEMGNSIDYHIKREIIVWGTGEFSKFLFRSSKILNKMNIIKIIDGNQNKWGKVFKGYNIEHPDVVKNNDASIVIASVNYYGEIANQIIAMGVSAKRIVPNIIL
jgi:FlaA1/EpsC-like NDP-sugar epimerase